MRLDLIRDTDLSDIKVVVTTGTPTDGTCEGCVFRHEHSDACKVFKCTADERDDGLNVIFAIGSSEEE